MSGSRESADDLTLQQTLRMMDVAVELRAQREAAKRELEIDEVRERLRAKLLETAQMTGESLTEADIDAALTSYYDNLHAFRPPPPGLATLLAHLYVRRWLVAIVAAGASIAAVVLWRMIGEGGL